MRNKMENVNNYSVLRARKRIKKIKEFYSHLITYISVNTFLIVINLVFSKNGGYWFIFPLLGWGIGLFSHAANVFNFIPFLGKDWEDRKLKQFIEEERNKYSNSL